MGRRFCDIIGNGRLDEFREAFQKILFKKFNIWNFGLFDQINVNIFDIKVSKFLFKNGQLWSNNLRQIKRTNHFLSG